VVSWGRVKRAEAEKTRTGINAEDGENAEVAETNEEMEESASD